MKRFVIEREIPGAAEMTEEELEAASRRSLQALRDLGPQIQWLHSYITDNKVYCVYLAPDADMVCRHAEKAGLPADRVSAVRGLLDPTNYS